MPWHYVYTTASGRLLSESSVAPDAGAVAALGAAVLERASRATDAEMWDAGTRAHVARPAKVLLDRIQDIAGDTRWNGIRAALTPAQRTTLVNLATELLGARRWRNVTETAAIQ